MERTADLFVQQDRGDHYPPTTTLGSRRRHPPFRVDSRQRGESVPSETLAMRDVPNDSKPVLLVNGFKSQCPRHHSAGNEADSIPDTDFVEFHTSSGHILSQATSTESSSRDGFGRSGSNYATTAIAGNTSDYPMSTAKPSPTRTRICLRIGRSRRETGDVKLTDYNTIQLTFILGKAAAYSHRQPASRWNPLPYLPDSPEERAAPVLRQRRPTAIVSAPIRRRA